MKSSTRFMLIRGTVFLFMLAGFVYQGMIVLEEYFSYPTTVDARIEGTETLLYPGLSFCITNWIDRDKLCELYEEHCNLSTPEQMNALLHFIETEGNLVNIALESSSILQMGFVNPAQYYFEFYLDAEVTQTSFSKLPTHMCYTTNWITDRKMRTVHQNIIAFEMNMMVSWPDHDAIVLDPYEFSLGFHHVLTNTAGLKQSLFLRPSGDYVFGVVQEGVQSMPPPYDTNCRNYSEMVKFGNYLVRYSQSMCYEDCRLRITKQICGCIPQDYVYRHHITDVVCNRKITVECVQRRSRQVYMIACEKECQTSCRETSYKATQSNWRQIEQEIDSTVQYINIKLIVTSRSVDVLHFIPLLTGTQILGTLGGYLGFWMGLSLFRMLATVGMFFFRRVRRKIKDITLNFNLFCCYQLFMRSLMGLSVVACVLSFLGEFYEYTLYSTRVRFGQENMLGLQFPAVTMCIFEGWQRMFSYVKSGSCYTFDMEMFKEHEFWDCPEPWKYRVKFRFRTTMSVGPVKTGATIAAHVHETGRFTSGIIHQFRFEAGKRYMITVSQTDMNSLQAPYETKCQDYQSNSDPSIYDDMYMQEEECCEACVAATWEAHCGCFSKMYPAKHRLPGDVCDYVTHLRCIDLMISKSWFVKCQQACTQGCREKRYRGLMYQLGKLDTFLKIPLKESELTVLFGSTRRRIIENVSKTKMSDFLFYLSGHATMWLEVSFLHMIPKISHKAWIWFREAINFLD